MSTKFEKRKLVREVQLPSHGMFYDALRASGGVVRVAALTTLEEQIFSGSGNTPQSKMDMILERCVDSGTLTPKEMLLGDRLFCLMHIRSLSYGDRYNFEFQCGKCGAQSRRELDLLKDIPLVEADEKFSEPYEITLPISGTRVGLRYFRGSDEAKISAYSDRESKKGNALAALGDVAYVYRLARHVALIDGKPPEFEADALRLVERLEGPDSRIFREAVDTHVIGFTMSTSIRCSSCGFEHDDVGVPMTGEFFRPKSPRPL